MRDYRDAKAMAQSLRTALAAKNMYIKQSESLELIAQTLGAKNWNTLSAAIRDSSPAQSMRTAVRFSAPKRLKKGETFPALPLRDVVFFPRHVAPLFVGRARSITAVDQAMNEDGRVLLVTQKRPTDEEPDSDAVFGVGVIAKILHLLDTGDGWLMLNVQTQHRAAIDWIGPAGKSFEARVAPIAESLGEKPEIARLSEQVQGLFQAYARMNNLVLPLPANSQRMPGFLADAVAMRLKVSISEKQEILEVRNVADRLAKVAALMERSMATA